jgi:hypothetical protein
MTTALIIVSILLYLAVGFIVSLVHYLGSTANKPISPLKWAFLAPYAGVVWLVKRF